MRTSTRTIAAAAALTLALGTPGCASTPNPERADIPTSVEVRNSNSLAVTVDAVSLGQDYRLGTVGTTDTESFTLPDAVNLTDVRILVEPIGSTGNYLSRELLVTPGDRIEVDVESALKLTTVVVH